MKYLKLLAFLPALFMMFVIWGFSDSNAEESSSLSLKVTVKVVDSVDKVTNKKKYTDIERNKLIEKLHTPVRKAAHITEYAILAMTIMVPLYLYCLTNKKRVLITAITSILYATSDEIHQIFIKERAGRVSDVMIDSIGIFMGIAIILGFYNILKKNVKN